MQIAKASIKDSGITKNEAIARVNKAVTSYQNGTAKLVNSSKMWNKIEAKTQELKVENRVS